MIKLRSNPDFLAAVSHYTIRDDMAVFRLLRCTGETSLDGVRSIVDNKCACWQCLLRWLAVAWHLLDSLDRFNVLGISSNGAPQPYLKSGMRLGSGCVCQLALSQRLSPLGLIFRFSTPTSGKMLLINFRIS